MFALAGYVLAHGAVRLLRSRHLRGGGACAGAQVPRGDQSDRRLRRAPKRRRGIVPEARLRHDVAPPRRASTRLVCDTAREPKKPERCLWGTDWTRAHAIVNYEQAVEPFRLTDRLNDSERAMLMGGACAKAYD